jgi:hypothetical protein
MSKSLLFLSLLLFFACRTSAGNKAKSQVSSVDSASSELVLQKIVGGIPEDSTKENVFDCKLMASDIDNLASVRKLIAEVPKDNIMTAMHFRAADPSIEIYAYQGQVKILIKKDESTLQYPASPDKQGMHVAALALEKIMDEKCPSPK